MAFMYNMFYDAIGHWKGFYLMIFNERYKVLIHNLLLTFIGVRNVQLLILYCPSNYPDDFKLIVKYKLVSIQLGK